MSTDDHTAGADPARTDPPQEEQEPDVRFTYANERTFLAWNRTALALIATGVAATQLLPSFEIDYGRRIIGVPLVILGAIVAIGGYRDWRANQQAMRRNEPLRRSPLPEILAAGIVLVAVIAAVLAAFAAR
jgi:putative membrane protein